MAENIHIDNLDKKILDIITKNARVPYLEVARECNVSGAAIHQRVQRLIKIGVINRGISRPPRALPRYNQEIQRDS
jgi:Lrp/AsnC family transcriptional regulator for asnA, asnC and gidA